MKNKQVDLSSLRINRSETQNSKQLNNIFKYLFIFSIVLLLVAVFVFKNKIFGSEIEVKTTTVFRLYPAEANAILTASGYVVAQRKASLASKATGRLVYLGVVEGDSVKKGQIIARIENDDVLAKVEQAEAALKLNEAELLEAKNNFERQKKLVDSDLSSKAELEAAEARYKRIIANIELAKAQLKQAKVEVEYTYIRAPFNGTVLNKNADIGEMVSPLGASTTSRSAVVTIADMSSLQVEADVSESNIQKIQAGQRCEISLDAYPDFRYQGYVDKIVPTADRSKATVLVKVAFRKYDSKVLPEMSAKVNFLTGSEDKSAEKSEPVLVIPSSALLKENGKTFVFVVDGNSAKSVEIKTGKSIGKYTEILNGLIEGEQVIISELKNIKDGSEIKIIK